MKTHDVHNERIKRRYLIFLKEAKRFSESSLDEFRDFRQFHIQLAVAFKADLATQRHARTEAPLSKATFDPKRAQSVFPVVGRPARLQITPQIRRR
jgi:integrase/recombinase XerD